MPKVGFSKSDAVTVEMGLQEGYVNIVNVESTIHQFSNKKGDTWDPFPCVAVTFQITDKNYAPVGGEEPATEYYSIGKMDKFHPGQMANGQDEDPEDLGDDVGVKGNCIVSVEGDKLNDRCKWILFTTELEAKGFKPEILGNGYLPDLIGTKGHVYRKKLEKGENYQGKRDPQVLVFDKIDVRPYEKKAVTGKATAAAPAAGKPKAAGAGKAGGGVDPEEKAKEVLGMLADDFSGSALETKALVSKATTKLLRMQVKPADHAGIVAFLKDEKWMGKQAKAKGFEYADGVATFPEPEESDEEEADED